MAIANLLSLLLLCLCSIIDLLVSGVLSLGPATPGQKIRLVAREHINLPDVVTADLSAAPGVVELLLTSFNRDSQRYRARAHLKAALKGASLHLMTLYVIFFI